MKGLILYDGYCGLCSASIDFVIKHDKEEYYSFLALQSDEGQKYLKKYNLPSANFNTVLLIEDDKVYAKSTAALKIAKNLSGVIKYIYCFIIIPEFIRDAIYTLVAKNRLLFFEKEKTCRIDIMKRESKNG